MSSSPESEMQSQWSNPGDILSLLLLIGGDIVQKALAQFVGFYIRPFKKGPRILLTPVAFSFGWVAYSFNSLMSIVGDNHLMPDDPDHSAILINCSNAYTRTNQSWILGRILRDHEATHEVDLSTESIRIDIFVATGADDKPDIDTKWILSWVVILVQQVLAAVPWIKYGDWTILMVTLSGTLAALVAGMLPQWIDEKWSTRRITKRKIVALTQGNGHHNVMVFINDEKRGPGPDIEALAGGVKASRSETRWISAVLSVFWVLLLITVSGLKAHSWFLIGVGGIGMLQNLYLAGASRTPGAFNIHLEPYDPPTIIGRRLPKRPPKVPLADLVRPGEQFQPLTQVGGVMGALMALENLLPHAGASLVPVFFPGMLKHEPERLKFQWEKDFWEQALSEDKEIVGI